MSTAVWRVWLVCTVGALSCARSHGVAPAEPPLAPRTAPRATTPQHEAELACVQIARELLALRRRYRALAELERTVEGGECSFRLAYRVGPPRGTGGISGALPRPHDDGVWFHLALYDPDGPGATAQINTQPVMPRWWIGPRRVTWLVQHGAHADIEQGKRLGEAVWDVLLRAGLHER